MFCTRMFLCATELELCNVSQALQPLSALLLLHSKCSVVQHRCGCSNQFFKRPAYGYVYP